MLLLFVRRQIAVDALLHVFAQLIAIKPYLTRMIVAVLADEWQNVVTGSETAYQQEVAKWIERNGEMVFLLLVDGYERRGLGIQHGRSVVSAPVYWVYAQRAV